MRVRGLDGRQYAWKLAGHEVLGDETRPRSAGHLLARDLLRRLFPFEVVLEEVAIPGCSRAMYFDFVVPRRRLAVEVQGVQHRRYVPHFHGNPRGFVEQKRRDQEKREFCLVNGLRLVEWHDDRTRGWERELLAPVGPGEGDGGGGPVE